MKLEFPHQIFEKSSNIEFYENPSLVGAELHGEGKTNRHDEIN
jgi:hypothetical protein